jgi:hypothetical protein
MQDAFFRAQNSGAGVATVERILAARRARAVVPAMLAPAALS